jgi:dihydrofolate synthase/folylpolyglutamate synthase
VEAARGEVPLTYFEFGTLAAWRVFDEAGLDAIVLEVGLGGRLDAVNVFDADCAIVTGIALDHMDYLGDTRDAIGFEKAGIFRPGRPAIVGDPLPPQSLLDHAQAIGADLRLHGRDFGIGAGSDRSQWQFWSTKGKRGGLAYPGLRGANQLLNAAATLAALECLQERLPVSMGAIRQGLITVELPGRFQVLPGRPAVVLDVAHNPQAAAVLADNLSNMGYFPETWAIVGMLGDKDIEGTLRHLLGRVDHWLVCDLEGPRAASADDLAAILSRLGVQGELPRFSSPQEAWTYAREQAGENDRIAIFGSFLTVAGVMQALAGR